jgi:hypothetical protein
VKERAAETTTHAQRENVRREARAGRGPVFEEEAVTCVPRSRRLKDEDANPERLALSGTRIIAVTSKSFRFQVSSFRFFVFNLKPQT